MRCITSVLVLGVMTVVQAKTISITIGQRAEMRGESLVVKATVGNLGDEAAKSVALNLRFGHRHVRGKVHEVLQPGATFEEELSIETGLLGDGRWPYQIAVDYADANLYSFQALLVTTTVVGSPPPATLSVPEIKSTGIARSGPLSITLKNLAGPERVVSYRVLVPEGLEATEPTGTMPLNGWGEETTSVEVVNRTALAGSRYPVFVAVEYEDGGTHQSVVAQGIVDIVAPRKFLEENQMFLLAGAALLVALWIVLAVRRATTRPS